MPSPPAATTFANPSSAAWRASSIACPACAIGRSSTSPPSVARSSPQEPFRPSATGGRVVNHTGGAASGLAGVVHVVTIRPMVEEDIPAALALWQGLPGIGLRDADSPDVARALPAAQPGMQLRRARPKRRTGRREPRGARRPPRLSASRRGRGRSSASTESAANWSSACLAALKAEGIEKVNLWVKADNATG